MKEPICQIVTEEELVTYADGDLSPGRTEQVAKHIADCRMCQTMLDALERSLYVTQAIWQTDEAQWPQTIRVEKARPGRKWFKPVVAIAASILLLLSVVGVWRLLSESSEPPRMTGKEPTFTEIEVAADRVATAAQLLAVADLLSSQPGGQSYAVKRYNDVIKSFPETEQSKQARRDLQSLLERR